jgi:hypothetical protein
MNNTRIKLDLDEIVCELDSACSGCGDKHTDYMKVGNVLTAV